ncbi:MAG: hypothetical protein K9G62_04365 [Alphaproteobacteria bacterium]|nr:hypothetical protein [Alphaproteobacteria bacterium]
MNKMPTLKFISTEEKLAHVTHIQKLFNEQHERALQKFTKSGVFPLVINELDETAQKIQQHLNLVKMATSSSSREIRMAALFGAREYVDVYKRKQCLIKEHYDI